MNTEIWILQKRHLSQNIIIILPLGAFTLFWLWLAIGLHQKHMSQGLIYKLYFAGKSTKETNISVTVVCVCTLRSKCAKLSLKATPMKKALNGLQE